MLLPYWLDFPREIAVGRRIIGMIWLTYQQEILSSVSIRDRLYYIHLRIFSPRHPQHHCNVFFLPACFGINEVHEPHKQNAFACSFYFGRRWRCRWGNR
jgi:hypothetical protein